MLGVIGFELLSSMLSENLKDYNKQSFNFTHVFVFICYIKGTM